MVLLVLALLSAALDQVAAEPNRLLPQQNVDLELNCGRFMPTYDASAGGETDFKSLYGEVLKRGQTPWVAAISMIRDDGILAMRGTGSLISPRHVISAAHLLGTVPSNCETGEIKFTREYSKSFVIFLNVSCSSEELCRKKGRDDIFEPRKVSKIYLRKGYVGEACLRKESLNDIVVFELEKDVTFDKDVYPLCIAKTAPSLDTSASLFGFGSDPSDKDMPMGFLKGFNTSISSCKEMGEESDLDGLLCSQSTRGQFACSGDSGAGLVRQRNQSKTKELVAVLSAGDICEVVYKEEQKIQQEGKSRPPSSKDMLVSVALNQDFFCDCCGICSDARSPKDSGNTFIIVN